MTITNRVSLKSVMAGVTPIADVPDAPTIGAATNVGTSRAYNNGSATVAYTAVPTGGTPTTFTATSTPGSFTGTGASPITVTGLQSATSYTFTVTPTNSTATGAASAASSSITATTIPQAPTIGTATSPTSTTASVPFTAGATGGSAITTFTATSSPGSLTGTSATSPITVSGLTPGTSYTFTVTATNANGTSTASSASNSVTPAYVLGGVGQGGGKIFYDAGSTLSWGRYLEAAESGWTDGNYDWQAPTQSDFVAGTSSAIGTGKANTDLMVAAKPTGGYAGTAARAYSSGGVIWSLPSPDEMVQLVTNRAYLSNSLSSGYSYWTSHNLGTAAYEVGPVPSTTINQAGKSSGRFVRPVRAFS